MVINEHGAASAKPGDQAMPRAAAEAAMRARSVRSGSLRRHEPTASQAAEGPAVVPRPAGETGAGGARALTFALVVDVGQLAARPSHPAWEAEASRDVQQLLPHALPPHLGDPRRPSSAARADGRSSAPDEGGAARSGRTHRGVPPELVLPSAAAAAQPVELLQIAKCRRIHTPRALITNSSS